MKLRTVLVLAGLALPALSPVYAQTNAVTIDGIFADWNDEQANFDSNDGTNPVCNDLPGEDDIKGAGIASNFNATMPGLAGTIYLRFDFDDIGAGGAITFDGCWLLDANGTGNVEQALCFTLQGNPALVTDTRYFTCADTTVDTCAMDVAVPLPLSASCAVGSVMGAEILNDCTAVDPADTEDRGVECEITVADLPVAVADNVVRLLQACSYDSQQPNSNGVDCVIDAGAPWTIDLATGTNTTPTVPVELFSFEVE